MSPLSLLFRLIDPYQLVVPTYLPEDVKILKETGKLRTRPKEKAATFNPATLCHLQNSFGNE
jgi:hypothetical protein